ncbi:MAG TPA: hypothetical protein VEY51_19730, partial [Chondromyces sp.]|nr:hypothetical protein [Chondromyces sp.]
SDRLNVEAAIGRLNCHYEQDISNARPHSVKAPQESILGHLFGLERTGGIYSNEEKVSFNCAVLAGPKM